MINEKDSGLSICLENRWIATDIEDLHLVDITLWKNYFILLQL